MGLPCAFLELINFAKLDLYSIDILEVHLFF
jgi:hypothetical protein